MTTRRAQRFLRLLPALLLVLAPLRLTGQQQPGTPATWADDVLKQEGYGPVVMKIFSKPYHQRGGLFVDFKKVDRKVTTDQQERR